MDYIYNTKLLASAIEAVNHSLKEYVSGNKAEVDKIESAIQEIENQLVVNVENSSPSEILDYLSKVVGLKLQVEELKVQKGTTLLNLLKSWAPFLVPLLVGVMTFAGVIVGINIQESNNSKTRIHEERKYEQQLILEIVKDGDLKSAENKLEALLSAGLFVHDKEKVEALKQSMKNKSGQKNQ